MSFASCKLTIRQRQDKGCRLTMKCKGCLSFAEVTANTEDMGKSKSYVDQDGNVVREEQLGEMWK